MDFNKDCGCLYREKTEDGRLIIDEVRCAEHMKYVWEKLGNDTSKLPQPDLN